MGSSKRKKKDGKPAHRIRYCCAVASLFVVCCGNINLSGVKNLQLSRRLNDLLYASNTSMCDASVIISSSLVPSHPSLDLIEATINSFTLIDGFSQACPIVITVDGISSDAQGKKSSIEHATLAEYNRNLEKRFRESMNVQVVVQDRKINLVGNIKSAIEKVDTEFVYVIQHDRPFIAHINHRALIDTFRDHADEVRLVRFGHRKTLSRRKDNAGRCGENFVLDGNGIGLSKTHTWSDSNHLTRKSYYEELFSTLSGWDGVRFMETKMNPLAFDNCTYWGTYLYGLPGHEPMIVHLDGRHVTEVSAKMDEKVESAQKG